MDGESKRDDLRDLRDASFSYLTSAQQNLVPELKESAQSPHPALASCQVTSIPISPEKARPDQEGEISVFGAEKYFNMKLDDETSGSIDAANAGKFLHQKIENEVELRRLRTKGRLGTPSVSSESSWNSQIALLPDSRRNIPRARQKKANERWYFPGFSCNGSCSDEKSVDIDTNVGHRTLQVAHSPIMSEAGKQPQSQSRFLVKDEFRNLTFEKMSIGSNRENYHVLPTMNSGEQNFAVRKEKKTMEEDPRKSLEVFRSHQIKKEDIALNLEKKISVLTWDAIPFPKAQNLPTTSASGQMYEDAGSEASSDLFEIENISCGTQQPIFTEQISDGMSGCMTPTSRYAPTENSIEWSVVTASAADFSAVPDYDEKRKAESNTNSAGLTSTPRNRRANSLLGCKSQKAVQVAETAQRRNYQKAKPQLHPQYRLEVSTPIIRKLPADSK